MGDYFNISADDMVTIAGTFDDMLTVFGKTCKLIYPHTETVCPNCIINTMTGFSTNTYKVGGPTPFIQGEVCPVCESKGYIDSSYLTDDITMVITWEPKEWLKNSLTDKNIVAMPGGFVLSRGMATDLSKVLKAERVFLDTSNPLIVNNYKLFGQPVLSGPITSNRYFIAMWERVG